MTFPMMCPSEMKDCTRCGVHRPLTEFQVRQASRDGLTASCKICLRAYDKTRGFHGRRGYALEYRTKHPHRRSAQVALNNALRDGRVDAWPVCALPECEAGPEAHHTHYDAPLEVVWLCPAHHKQAHAMARKVE
jgi:hypothetical protein